MSESVYTATLDDYSGSVDSVVAGSANLLLFEVILLINYVVFISFSSWLEFQKTQSSHNTYHSLTSLISVKMLFLQGTMILINYI